MSGDQALAPKKSPLTTNGGAPNGSSRARPFDRWFRYPAGFSSDALTAALSAVGASEKTWLVDPFAGTATAGQLALDNGWQFAGIEAHPAIAELAQLKFSRPGDSDGLVDSAADLLARTNPCPIEAEPDMVQRCFEPDVLRRLVGLREEILKDRDDPWAGHLKWALLGCLRDVASVKVGWPYQRPDVARKAPHKDVERRFLQRVQLIADDLSKAVEPNDSLVVQGDSSSAAAWKSALGTKKAAACVTSPPYLNNFDYADATRLEMYFWGVARSWSELCSDVRSDMLTATTQQTRVTTSRDATDRLRAATTTSKKIDAHIASLQTERLRRPRGKEYDRILAPYFLGIGKVLSLLHSHLAPGAPSAWVVGDSAPYGMYIDTPKLISEMAVEVGFEFEGDVLVRNRGARWRTNGTRHQVELSERMVVFRKPKGTRRGQGVRQRLLEEPAVAT